MDRSAGRRAISARAARRRGAVRLCRRAAFLEALSPSSGRAALAGSSRGGRLLGHRKRRSRPSRSPLSACAPASFARSPFMIGSFWLVNFSTSPTEIRRDHAFIVAVNCSQAGGTCFCVSMDAGPKVEAGFDLSLTELIEEGRHLFVMEVGSAAGARSGQGPAASAGNRGGNQPPPSGSSPEPGVRWGVPSIPTGLKELLQANPNHPRWDEVAERCLTCGNCTNVCPTCFCTTIDDTTDLSGDYRRAGASLGFLLYIGLFLYPWRQCAQLGALALPPMDDAQAGALGRSVRQLRLCRLRPLHHLVSGRDRHYRGSCGDPVGPRDLAAPSRRVSMQGLERIVLEHPFFTGLGPEFAAAISGCARNLRFARRGYLFREGEPADEFYLIRQGRGSPRDALARPTADRRRNLARGRHPRWVVAGAALLLDLRCARLELVPRPRGRCPMPAREVRSRSRSRLRADEAFRRCHGRTATTRHVCKWLDVYGTDA